MENKPPIPELPPRATATPSRALTPTEKVLFDALVGYIKRANEHPIDWTARNGYDKAAKQALLDSGICTEKSITEHVYGFKLSDDPLEADKQIQGYKDLEYRKLKRRERKGWE